jgi:hypothetical protein
MTDAACKTCGGRGYVGVCDCGAEQDGLGGHDWECSAFGPAVGPAAERKPCSKCSPAEAGKK